MCVLEGVGWSKLTLLGRTTLRKSFKTLQKNVKEGAWSETLQQDAKKTKLEQAIKLPTRN